MRRTHLTAIVVAVYCSSAIAQAPKIGPPPTVPAIPPTAPTPILTLPTPAVTDPAPPPEFGVGQLPGTVVAPGVRPPAPVSGAPIEVPPGPLFWTDLDYLLWRSKGGIMPPLVAAINGPAASTVPIDTRWAHPISDDKINGDLQSGFRLAVGMWLDKPHGTGFEAAYTMFMSTGDTATYFSAPNMILGRPFIDVNRPGVVALFQLSNPSGTAQGIAQVRTSFDSDSLEVNMLRRGPAMIGEEMHWIIGVRYFGLRESLTIEGATESAGTRVGSFDTFATRNNFYGGQFGGRWNFNRDRFSFDFIWKLAIGGMAQESVINGGSSAVLPNGARIDREGGLLALSSNIGEYDRVKLALIRDATLNLGYAFTPNIKMTLGYNFMWVSSVLRPGNQVDLGVNPRLFPFSGVAPTGPQRPAQRFDGEEFWMHGINLGLSVQF